MVDVLDLPREEVKKYLLEEGSYFNTVLPKYIKFAPMLERVDKALRGKPYPLGDRWPRDKPRPNDLRDVNYEIITSKNRRLDSRSLELIHPVLYVSLVNTICQVDNWREVRNRFTAFKKSYVTCCSLPVKSTTGLSGWAEQVRSWWQKVEQQSLERSLKFSHMLQTDIVNCYGSLYTHSIEWALDGREVAKKRRRDRKPNKSLGHKIDRHIQAMRYGQTNGICQGSALMALIAELVLGYVDMEITKRINEQKIRRDKFEILRYRDDYRIFTDNKELAERLLQIIASELRELGMSLGAAKTRLNYNVVGGSVKRDKLAGISLQGLGTEHARTIQKRLLRLQSFGKKYPNSGAIRRLLTEFYIELVAARPRRRGKRNPKIMRAAFGMVNRAPHLDEIDISRDLRVLVAIVADIGLESPAAFPIAAAIISQLLSAYQPRNPNNRDIWKQVRTRVGRFLNNEHLEIWIQRAMIRTNLRRQFSDKSKICKIVGGQRRIKLWNSAWILDNQLGRDLRKALSVANFVDPKHVRDAGPTIEPDEVVLFGPEHGPELES